MNGKEVVTLKDYIDLRFSELEKQLQIRFDSMDTALNLASDKTIRSNNNKRWAIGIIIAIACSIAALLVNIF